MEVEKNLALFADQIRLETVKTLKHRGFGHVGGCMSVVELLAVLYGDVMKYDPENPTWDERDYLIMSKGHAGPALFSTLALKGFFPVEDLETLCEPGTMIPSHCDRLRTRGVDVSTGSLGQGLSVAAGLLQGWKVKGEEDRWVYVVLGDGECGEGQIWEAAMCISSFGLSNVIAFIDWNKRQVDGYVKDIMDLGDLEEKFGAFGWKTMTVNGKDVNGIKAAIVEAKNSDEGKPVAVILDGIKGSGVKEYEDLQDNHFFELDQELAAKVIADLEEKIKEEKNA